VALSNEVKTGKKRSLINTYFTKDIYIELLKVTLMTDVDNNDKGIIIKQILKNHNIPFTGLGSGTNRMAVLIDGYAVKFALDRDGEIDNCREVLYTKALQPFVIKVYESTPDGLIAVSEFVEIFTLDDFHIHQNQMRSLLKTISTNFLIGDVGVTTKNYLNWGFRSDGTICMLDFAYCYSVKYKLFECGTCSEQSLLTYDSDYNNLKCPNCGRTYTFGDIRKRISRTDQEKEIGDIRRLGYNIKSACEVVELNPEFEPKVYNKKEKVKSEKDIFREDFFKSFKELYGEDKYVDKLKDYGYTDILSLEYDDEN
jgi:hypothetical protein